MAGKGASEGNQNATKEVKGKRIGLYLPSGVLPNIKKLRKDRGEQDTSVAACTKEAREYALDGIQKLDKLRYLADGWQVLSNHAEIFAPELLNNPQWIVLKRSLEQRTDELGVTEFIRQVGEKYREKIESEEEE